MSSYLFVAKKKGVDGEWVKAPKVLGAKVYTLPPAQFSSKPKTGHDDRGPEDNEHKLNSHLPPLDGGNPNNWYKSKGTWAQLQKDDLGFIDPYSDYGRQVKRDQEEQDDLQRKAEKSG